MTPADQLADDQHRLLHAVLGGQEDAALWALLPSPSAANPAETALQRRGLQAYQSHGLALAARALQAAYPVIAELMGEDNFAALAPHFWRMHPPISGDMGCWGDGLAGFLAAAPQLADEPFLADVARVEWALHRASFAADASPDLASLALLAAEPPAEPSLILSPGVWLLTSAYPVVSLVQAHRLTPEARQPALVEAAALLACGTGEHALVWRAGFKPLLRAVSAAEHALLAALQAGHSLETALLQTASVEGSSDDEPFDFTAWLAQSVNAGLVTGACLIDPSFHNKKVST